jgi:Nuclear pore protein 84 / 107
MERRPLESTDAQTQSTLHRIAYQYVRAGEIESAKQVYIKSGQPIKAACLNGMFPFSDPVIDREHVRYKLLMI